MRLIFADAVYYIALLMPKDQAHSDATSFDDRASDLRIVTTDAIFAEVLAYCAARGTHARTMALRMIDDLMNEPRVTVVRQTPELFDEAPALYRLRPDKAYTLVDCMSMVLCRERGITEVLTFDRHFIQEGFDALLRQN